MKRLLKMFDRQPIEKYINDMIRHYHEPENVSQIDESSIQETLNKLEIRNKDDETCSKSQRKKGERERNNGIKPGQNKRKTRKTTKSSEVSKHKTDLATE